MTQAIEHDFATSMVEYMPPVGAWIKNGCLNVNKCSAAGAVIGGDTFIAGGYNPPNGFFNTMEKFSADEVHGDEFKTPMSTARSNLIAEAVNGKI